MKKWRKKQHFVAVESVVRSMIECPSNILRVLREDFLLAQIFLFFIRFYVMNIETLIAHSAIATPAFVSSITWWIMTFCWSETLHDFVRLISIQSKLATPSNRKIDTFIEEIRWSVQWQQSPSILFFLVSFGRQ